MIYILIFLPAICSAAALAVSLAYGRNKNALIIAAVAAMSVFLLVKDTLSLAAGVNAVALTFALVYLSVSLYVVMKKRREGETKC